MPMTEQDVRLRFEIVGPSYVYDSQSGSDLVAVNDIEVSELDADIVLEVDDTMIVELDNVLDIE